jgi:hypothetical protein
MCYGCQIKALANMILLTQTWAIAEAICDALSLVVITCVVNHRCGYWLFFDALAFVIKLYVRLTKEKLQL